MKVRKRLKRLNKTAGLSPVAILATASGAITMAFLTTQLASSGSSLILTGVISASAAIINGFYKVIISGVGKKTKEVVKTANTVLISGVTEKEDDGVEKEEDGEEEEEDSPSEESKDEEVEEPSKPKRTFIEFLNRNNFLILLTVFILLSLGTIGVTKFLQDKEVIHMYTYETNEIREVQEVSMTEEDKQELLSDILYILEQQSDEVEEDQFFEEEEAEEEVKEDPELDELGEEIKDEHKQILDEQLSLERNLELLESKLIESDRSIDKLSNDLKTSNRSVKELENRVKELEQMNSELREERTG